MKNMKRLSVILILAISSAGAAEAHLGSWPPPNGSIYRTPLKTTFFTCSSSPTGLCASAVTSVETARIYPNHAFSGFQVIADDNVVAKIRQLMAGARQSGPISILGGAQESEDSRRPSTLIVSEVK